MVKQCGESPAGRLLLRAFRAVPVEILPWAYDCDVLKRMEFEEVLITGENHGCMTCYGKREEDVVLRITTDGDRRGSFDVHGSASKEMDEL